MSDDLVKSAIDFLPEGVIFIDKDFRITFINKVAELLTGYSKNDVLNKYCRDVFNPDYCNICPITYILKQKKNVYDVETEILTVDKNAIPVLLNASLFFDENNEPVGGLLTFRKRDADNNNIYNITSSHYFYGLIGKSRKMREIFNFIKDVSETDIPILIQGESGTGKELIADAIFQLSKRRNKRFVKLNCAVIPQTLVGSELFGHRKGAFTDAICDRIGRFEYADKGTIFLDEINELSLNTQAQLLRIIEEGTFERIGESETRKIDVRIIAATNTKLEDEVTKGNFREDLFYRLNVAIIDVPPLRERREDIPILINYFINKFSVKYKKNIKGIDPNVLDLLLEWKYSGNVRELENIIEFSIVRSKTDTISFLSLPEWIKKNINNSETNSKFDISSSYLIELLNKHKWNKTKVAEILGIDRSTLWRKLKSIGL